jgi:hypothetical protein
MSEGTEKTAGSFSTAMLVAAIIVAAVVGAGAMYLLTPKAALTASEAVEIFGGGGLEGLDPGAALRTWASAFAIYTYHQINRVYSVYNWDVRVRNESGAWNIVHVEFSGELPSGDLHTFGFKVRAQ